MAENQEKIPLIHWILDKEYPDTIMFLQFRTPLQLVIGVILSAQTTDKQVNAVLPELFTRFPNAEAIGNAQLRELEGTIKSTGFYHNKAKNIKATAGIIHTKYDDEIPENMNDLLSLPGIGRKSANVIRGALFDKPAVIVDTHFSRVIQRIGLTDEKTPEKIEKDILSQLPAENTYRFSMTINYHGRYVCTARKPSCGECVIEHVCSYSDKFFPG
ncbi:MAG: endonuclease III domain-containing protein [Spirochaetia bacterium]